MIPDDPWHVIASRGGFRQGPLVFAATVRGSNSEGSHSAAHCDQDVSRVAVTFDTNYRAATGTERWGTWQADPSYTQSQSDPHDLAVVVLDDPVGGITPALLRVSGAIRVAAVA